MGRKLHFITLNGKSHYTTNKPTLIQRCKILYWKPRTLHLRQNYYNPNNKIKTRPQLDLRFWILIGGGQYAIAWVIGSN